jgi:hypothetical protein
MSSFIIEFDFMDSDHDQIDAIQKHLDFDWTMRESRRMSII